MSFEENTFISLKNEDWIGKQRVAGRITARALSLAKDLVLQSNRLTTLQLSKKIEEFILENNCTPTFKGYKGFPEAACVSINEQLVHGIPNDYLIQEGDVVKVDLGCTYKFAIADSAITFIKGKPKSEQHVKLIEACRLSLENAIKQIAPGKRMGVIGNGINHIVKNTKFSIITQYGGHGLDYDHPHAQPFIPNKSNPQSGVRIQPGMSFAVEPQIVIGEAKTRVLSDGWTVVTPGIGAHFEHSIFVHNDKVEIITELDEDKKFLKF